MVESPSTRPSLLLRLRDAQDHEAWSQFVALYAPLIYGYVRRRGLQDQDAADLLQDVLSVVARHLREWQYDRNRGSFRGWLFTITHRKLLNFLAAQRGRVQASGDTSVLESLHQQPARDRSPQEEWDQAHEQQLFAWACDQVRPRLDERTWQAFWATAVECRPARNVGAELGMTPAAVRLAKSRVMAHIRKVIQELQVE